MFKVKNMKIDVSFIFFDQVLGQNIKTDVLNWLTMRTSEDELLDKYIYFYIFELNHEQQQFKRT